ncbi:MAG: hypothetical protein ACSLFB_08495 [Acidimicrobiales bacterium]
MVTLLNDRVTPDLLSIAVKLLPDVTDAGELLATSHLVSGELHDLVEAVIDRLPIDDLEVGFAEVDPYLGEAILAGALVCTRALRTKDPIKQRQMLRLSIERLRQALRDLLDETPTNDNQPLGEILQWLLLTLDTPQHEIAELLGVSHRTLQRWVSPTAATLPSGDEAARVRVIARLANHLRHSYTGAGVIRWFQRPHPDLGKRSPRDLLDDPTEYPLLVKLASRARSTNFS